MTVGPYNVDMALADTDHLVELLNKLYDNPDLRAEYGRTGREFAETMTWDRCAEQWAQLLEEVAANRTTEHRTTDHETTDHETTDHRTTNNFWASVPVLSPNVRDGGPPDAPLRIAVMSTFDYPCGIGVYTENLVREWRKQGHEVWCLAERVAPEDLRKEFPEEQTIRCWIRGRSFEGVAKAVRRLQPDIVNIQHEHAFCWDAEMWDALIDQVQTVCPVVVTYHTFIKEVEKVNRNPRPDSIIVANPHAFEGVLREGWSPEKVWFVPHAPSHPVSPLPTEINHRIITFGILGSGKGYGECLEALKLLRQDFPEATLTIHGSLVPGKWKEQARFMEQDLMPGIWKRGLDLGARLVLGWPSEVDMQSLITNHSVTWLMYHHFDSAWCASASLQMALSACRPVITSWAHHFDVTPDLHRLVYHTDKVEDVARQTAALWRNPRKYATVCHPKRLPHRAQKGMADVA